MPTSRSTSVALFAALVGFLLLGATPAPAEARTYECRGEVATIVGTHGDDVIEGTDGDDVIVALKGDDVIFSFEGDDLICAGQGDDVVFSGGGNDKVFGQSDDDFVYGGPGDDRIQGGDGDDVIEGGPGETIASGFSDSDELWGTWCTPPRTMQHFCRWPDLTVTSSDYAALFDTTRVLRIGTSGDDVLALQVLLTDLGYDPGDDGSFGAATESAVRSFQDDAGLTTDGAVGARTRAALEDAAGAVAVPPLPDDWTLGKATTLRPGNAGASVAALQRTLTDLGYDPGPIDGVYGPGTEAAVRAFQNDAGLDVDGKAGTLTKRALFGDLGAEKVLRGGPDYDTCGGATRKGGCDGRRGLRPGAPWDDAAAEEWRPLITEVFTAWDLEEEIDRAVAIVACESLADPMITTPAGSGYYWVGLFQHTDRYWEARADRAGIPGASIYDPRANAEVSAMLVRESIDGGASRGPWAHWGCGSLLGYWDS